MGFANICNHPYGRFSYFNSCFKLLMINNSKFQQSKLILFIQLKQG